ncbi:hypothetical protein [Kribbella sp. NPDC050459]|uniref:hypothetical protein n=1 Tax=Kribbella sp. NPDC050459 TaxID=3155785 RepID=UPI003401E960
MSNQSYDEKVKAILDRVAKGHLSTEEATTLIAAIKPAADAGDTSTADGPGAKEPVAEEGTQEVPRRNSTDWPAAEDLASPEVWADAVDSPAAEPVAEPAAEPAAERAPEPAAEAVVEPAVEEAEPVEEEHSNVPIPSGVQRVTVRAIGRRVRLIGEPAVNGVAVDGPHVIKRDGDTLAISSEGDMGVSIDGFSMLRNPTDLKAHVNGLAKELSIRVNPQLQVEVEVTGGSVNAERLPGLSRVRVTAGTAKVSDVDGPIDVLVQAGSANLDAQITKGRSRVRVESGTAQVALRRGSDVHVHTEAQLGRVTWTGAVSGQSKDVEIGRGRAALDVEVLVGTAQIASD